MAIRLVTTDSSFALRWTDQHPRSQPGRGVLLYRHSGDVLGELPAGAVVEVSTIREAHRVARALALSEEIAATCVKVR